MKKILLIFLFSSIIFTVPVFAHCPLCTAATGAIVATTRFVGVDDIVVGTFIGAFTVSTAFWMSRVISGKFLSRIKSFNKKYVNASLPYILSVVFVALTLAGFYAAGLLDPMYNFYIWGIEKLTAGVLIGTVVTIVAFDFHRMIRRLNKDKNYFPMQGILLPLIILAVVNALFYMSGVAL